MKHKTSKFNREELELIKSLFWDMNINALICSPYNTNNIYRAIFDKAERLQKSAD